MRICIESRFPRSAAAGFGAGAAIILMNREIFRRKNAALWSFLQMQTTYY